MAQEVECITDCLRETKRAIEDGVDNLERGKKMRDLKRKEILVAEMKQALATLAETDTKIVKDLKGEAFDMIRSVSKIFEEAKSMEDSLGDNHSLDAQKKVESLKDQMRRLGMDEFLRSLDISVSIQPGFMTAAFEKIYDGLYLNSPVLDPRQFFLQIPEKQLNFKTAYDYKHFDIHIFTANKSLVFTPMVVMHNLQVEVMGQMPEQGQGKMILEQGSVLSKMEKMKAKISEDGSYVTVQIKRGSDVFGRISVKVLGSNIVNSPILHEFSRCHKEIKDVSVTNDTLGMFDMTGLDESDLASLDMTTRRQMLLSAWKKQLLSNPTFPASPAFQAQRKVSRLPNISSVPEAPSMDYHSQLGETNPPDLLDVTLPLIDPIHEEDGSDEDPHLMLNASNAPSPISVKSWGKEDSIWNDVPEYDQDEEDIDPHLLLNASKAPPPGEDWPTVDPSWSDTSMLPEVHQSLCKDKNQTVWGDDLDEVDIVDFITCSLEEQNVFKSQKVAESSSRGATYCLESPCCVTFLTQKGSFLVTEPVHDRVGLYDGNTFKFLCWMGYPEQVGNGRTFYNYPTSVLALDNGFVVLLEKDRLHVFDGQVRQLQSIEGVFHGLAEGQSGDVFTLSKNKGDDIVVIKLAREGAKARPGMSRRSHYKVFGQIKLSVIQTFHDWQTVSKARFITYSQEKVFITDLGLHKLYMVNLVTGEQTASSYMGSKVGQFKRPTGLVVDDVGNLIMGDSENNRLVVVNKLGNLVRDFTGLYCFPHDLVRVDNSLLAVHMATKDGEQGAIVRYKLVGIGEFARTVK